MKSINEWFESHSRELCIIAIVVWVLLLLGTAFIELPSDEHYIAPSGQGQAE
jgi:hypothetical protein